MSYDIDLINPAEEDECAPVGHYSDRLACFWHQHIPTGNFNDLDGHTGAYAAPLLGVALCALVQDVYGYSRLPTAHEGEYEEATVALAEMWAACRSYPDHIFTLTH